MRLKKKTGRLLALFVLAALLTLPTSAAGTTLSIHAPETLPSVGETFTVTVEISGNPGLCAAQYTLTFDRSVVSCEGASVGNVLAGTLSATNPKAVSGAIIAAATVSPAEGDGTIGEFTFKVVGEGTTSFTLDECVFTGENDRAITTNIPSVSTGTAKSAEPVKPVEPTEPTKPAEPTKPETPDEPTKPAEPAGQTFSDVPKTFWGYEYIEAAAAKGLVNGMTDGTYAPDREMTRAEFVTVLWRMAGKPAATKTAPFTDVPANAWYRDAVNWAAEKKVVNGTSDTTFGPDGKVTRQEAVTILFRYSGSTSGTEAMLTGVYDSQFTDSDTIAPWARSAVYWAVYNGVINGTSDTTVSPTGTASRAQVAAILVRYSK